MACRHGPPMIEDSRTATVVGARRRTPCRCATSTSPRERRRGTGLPEVGDGLLGADMVISDGLIDWLGSAGKPRRPAERPRHGQVHGLAGAGRLPHPPRQGACLAALPQCGRHIRRCDVQRQSRCGGLSLQPKISGGEPTSRSARPLLTEQLRSEAMWIPGVPLSARPLPRCARWPMTGAIGSRSRSVPLWASRKTLTGSARWRNGPATAMPASSASSFPRNRRLTAHSMTSWRSPGDTACSSTFMLMRLLIRRPGVSMPSPEQCCATGSIGQSWSDNAVPSRCNHDRRLSARLSGWQGPGSASSPCRFAMPTSWIAGLAGHRAIAGCAPVHEMRQHGIPVAIASDNVRDAFYAYGDLDVPELFRDAVRMIAARSSGRRLGWWL